MRERLIELLKVVELKRQMRASIEECADYLLENDAIALPNLKYRQKLYFLYEGKIKTLEFSSYYIRPEFNNLIQIYAYKNGFNGCCNVDDIGKTVFLTKEEAEAALKEKESKNA